MRAGERAVVEIINRETLEAWLGVKDRGVAIAIGTRTALRVVPLIVVYVRAQPVERSAAMALPIFRAIAAPWVAGKWPTQGTAVSAAAARAASAAARAASAYAYVAAAAAAASASARAASDSAYAYVAAAIWAEIRADADALEKGLQADALMRRPLWTDGAPEWAEENWAKLKTDLLALDEDWHVWTDWYDDRLRGADHPDSRSLIEELELERVLISNADWEKGPKHINGMIAALELEYRAKPPPQRSAIIEVEYGRDGKLHRRPSGLPTARNEAQEQRLREAWTAHSDQLATLEELDPGGNLPGLGSAMKHYRAALGSTYETMNVIALGVHGSTVEAHAARADELLLEDAAAELVGLAATHGLFIRQFDTWLDYVSDASGEPTAKLVEHGCGFARSTRDASEIIADDVSIPIGVLADAAEQPLGSNIEERPPQIVERELLRSVGNILSGLFAPLVDFARDTGSAARKGSLRGTEDFAERTTLAIAIGVSAHVMALVSGLPGVFGWIVAVLALLKRKSK